MSEPAADLFAALDPAGLLPADHDDGLLESLVERGCEDNLVLLETAAHPATPASPGRSSMTAAQGLLHLHMFSDSAAAPRDPRPDADLPYGSDATEVRADGDVHTESDMTERAYDNVHITAVVSENEIAEQTYENIHMAAVSSDDNITEQAYENIHMTEVVSDNNVPEQSYVNLHMTAVAPEDDIAEQGYDNVHMTGVSSENNITEQVYESVHMSAEVSENNITEQGYKNDHMTEVAPEHDMPAPVYDEISEASPHEVTMSEELRSETADERPEYVPEEEEDRGESCNSESSRAETDNEYGKEATPTMDEMIPTDLSMKRAEVTISALVRTETVDPAEDALSDRSDEQPRDLSIRRPHPHTPQVSPRRPEPVRAPSRESDAMQSPQPSGIPAVPSSPELFSAPVPQPQTKSNKTLFLESLLSSPSPKMYTSEVTITKRQCEPLNLGKHRKSASPTVSSCSEEIKKTTEESDEPDEKKIKTEEDIKLDLKNKKRARTDDHAALKAWRNFRVECNLPDPLLVPKDKLNDIIASPIAELSTLLLRRPELRLPDVFSYPAVLQDPDILVVSLAQLDNILETRARVPDTAHVVPHSAPHAPRDTKPKSEQRAADRDHAHRQRAASFSTGADLAGDIDAATAAAFNQMIWLPYLSHLEQTYGRTQAELAKVAAASGAPSPIPPSRSPAAPYPPGRPHETSRAADLQHPYVHSTRPPYYPYSSGGAGSHTRGPPAAPSYYPKYRPAAPEPPRPRISVKSLHNLLEPAGVSGGSASRRRREDPEVGSTTPLGELPSPAAQVYSHHGLQSLHAQHAQHAQLAQHALHGQHTPLNHNQQHSQVWHPLFGNQLWKWTKVTATGD